MIKKNIFSFIVALAILCLSLADSKTFNNVPFFSIPYLDKIVHFLMYFVLMSVILFEHRKTLSSVKRLILFALIPFSYGILMEILQITIATNRSGSFYDVLANSAGIIVSALLWQLLNTRLSAYFKW